jgi:hypothetical protein
MKSRILELPSVMGLGAPFLQFLYFTGQPPDQAIEQSRFRIFIPFGVSFFFYIAQIRHLIPPSVWWWGRGAAHISVFVHVALSDQAPSRGLPVQYGHCRSYASAFRLFDLRQRMKIPWLPLFPLLRPEFLLNLLQPRLGSPQIIFGLRYLGLCAGEHEHNGGILALEDIYFPAPFLSNFLLVGHYAGSPFAQSVHILIDRPKKFQSTPP